jgi:hypothetical protein
LPSATWPSKRRCGIYSLSLASKYQTAIPAILRCHAKPQTAHLPLKRAFIPPAPLLQTIATTLPQNTIAFCCLKVGLQDKSNHGFFSNPICLKNLQKYDL